MADGKRPSIVIWIIPLIVGLAGLFRVMQTPGFAAYRTVDVVRLLGSGACFAVMVGVVLMLRARKS
jgi:hypothetical protein